LRIGVTAGRIVNNLKREGDIELGNIGTRAYLHEYWSQYSTGEKIIVSPGNSGSPVFTTDNQLIGNASQIYGPTTSTGEIDPTIVAFAGPSVIRALLNHYVTACNTV